MLLSTLIGTKPPLSYNKLCEVLARAASIINDRPIGLRAMTETKIVPLTVNQLLLGCSTTTNCPTAIGPAVESYMAVDAYQQELIRQC